VHIEKYICLNPDKHFLEPQELIVKAVKGGNRCKLFLAQGPYSERTEAGWDWLYEAVLDAWQMYY
jgi:hypothetical protein